MTRFHTSWEPDISTHCITLWTQSNESLLSYMQMKYRNMQINALIRLSDRCSIQVGQGCGASVVTGVKERDIVTTLFQRLFQLSLQASLALAPAIFCYRVLSTAMDTKIITLDELRANKSRERFYILVHGKGTSVAN